MFIANDALRADIQEDEWIIDSGASKHMTFNRCVLRHYKEFETPEPVGLGDGRTVNALGMGEVKFTSYLPHNRTVSGWMSNVLFVPQLANNLFSVCVAALDGNVVSFGSKCRIKSNKKLIGTGSPVGKLYKLNCEVMRSLKEKGNVPGESEQIALWHKRLASATTSAVKLC